MATGWLIPCCCCCCCCCCCRCCCCLSTGSTSGTTCQPWEHKQEPLRKTLLFYSSSSQARSLQPFYNGEIKHYSLFGLPSSVTAGGGETGTRGTSASPTSQIPNKSKYIMLIWQSILIISILHSKRGVIYNMQKWWWHFWVVPKLKSKILPSFLYLLSGTNCSHYTLQKLIRSFLCNFNLQKHFSQALNKNIRTNSVIPAAAKNLHYFCAIFLIQYSFVKKIVDII